MKGGQSKFRFLENGLVFFNHDLDRSFYLQLNEGGFKHGKIEKEQEQEVQEKR